MKKILILFSIAFFLPLTTHSAVVNKASPSSLKNGLVGYWTFDGKDVMNGVARDVSGNNNHGNLISIATSTFYTQGKMGQGFRFAGINQIKTGSDFIGTTAITFSVWTKIKGQGGSNAGTFFDNGKTQMYLQSAGRAFFSGNGSSNVLSCGTSVLSYDNVTWYHIVVTRTASGVANCYVNGSASGTADQNSGTPEAGNTNVNIGNSNSGNNVFDGILDDVRVYNRVLSANEVRQLYSQGAGTKQAVAPKQAIKNGLVGYWTFDGKDVMNGVARDVSGNNNHGNLISIATSTFYTQGKMGQGFRFDGVNDYVSTSDIAALDSLAATTYCAWVNLPSTTSNQTVVGKYESSGTIGLFLQTYTSGSIALGFNANHFVYTSAAPIIVNTWQHWCGTFDNALGTSKHKIYIDAVSQNLNTNGSPDSVTSTGASSAVLSIGQNISLGRFLTGKIDDVRVYNRALSASEIQQLYNQGSAGKISASPKQAITNGLVGYWTFDGKDVMNGVARDVSGNNNHGNLISIATSTFYTQGKMGQGFGFDGVNDYVITPAITFGSNLATVSYWFYATSFNNSDALTVELSSNYNANNGTFVVNHNSSSPSGLMVGSIQDGGGAYRVESFTRPSTNAWHHYVWFFDNSTATGNIDLYIDGVAQTTIGIPNNNKSGTNNFKVDNIYLMSRGGSTLFQNGKIDDVRVYNRALSASEIQQLYNMGK